MNDEHAPQITDLLSELRSQFTEVGIGDPDVDAELLVGHVLGESRGAVQASAIMGKRLTEAQASRLRDLSELRAQRVPLQHLTGRAPFRSIELRVGPGVFVPRPETETVAQFAVDALGAAATTAPLAVDLCTGSGAIALALAREVPNARVWAVEKSAEAHAWAAENVAALGDGRVELIHGDLADFVPGRLAPAELAGNAHVVISNPPYVPNAMVPRDAEVRDHDPELALYGGNDGLDVIRVISGIAMQLLLPGGSLVLEHAEGQGAAIRELLARDGWRACATHPDLTGRDRATTALK
ncbi:peptide chain release factor N(5)-glutamine methyltransferase [Leucobacter komagatae]|uniref:Release factor glutamine methyltransferase n=1 Tax=Leucobacter komagatae TaxID=55969 RepID=A0A0D0IPX6_9MICO|nr:SAM-dependent methyltransferase [Leucobacter komagatae]